MGKWFIEAFLVFVGYTAAYTLTLGFVYPMQKILLPENSLMASLLFLPHGVRAIAFFLFGLRATLYLLPAHYAMWYITVHGADIGLDVFFTAGKRSRMSTGVYIVFICQKNSYPSIVTIKVTF